MGIEKEEELVLLIHQSHRYVTGKSETWWSRRIQTIGDDHVPDRVNYTVFQSNLYWAVRIVVVSFMANGSCGYDGGDCDDTKQSGSISALGRINARLVHIRKSNSSSSIHSNDTNSEHKSKNVLD